MIATTEEPMEIVKPLQKEVAPVGPATEASSCPLPQKQDA
jgi:hypothetical protein